MECNVERHASNHDEPASKSEFSSVAFNALQLLDFETIEERMYVHPRDTVLSAVLALLTARLILFASADHDPIFGGEAFFLMTRSVVPSTRLCRFEEMFGGLAHMNLVHRVAGVFAVAFALICHFVSLV
ncbi:hypothetical protein TRM7615_04365 [Falsiruegeria mediterranea M17]|uniref:Uncharacterized protein n=1 Tax=Falsiruegeria mediterranea M17 TaxID=1200281 RepID=A0A2R8CEV8_9RHOB|nr:hypothetical protein TRM7615_04365 [Falsiruegeria mediterranea M17]